MNADPVWTAACAREVDELSIGTFGIRQTDLMERAGTAVANIARSASRGKSFLVLAGSGNNGGDALIAARVLATDPAVRVVTIRVSKTAADIPAEIPAEIPMAKLIAEPFHCIIDGVFGLGFRGPLDPSSPAALTLKAAAQIKAKYNAVVVAVDLPSGLTSDDGGQTEALLRADETVTFGALKAVHAVAPARDLCGTVHCVDIGFSNDAVRSSLAGSPPVFGVVHGRDLLADDPWSNLSPSAHKYDRGHVLVVGGSAGKTGAPILSALAALRSGAGWATLAMPGKIISQAVIPPDLTTEALWSRGNRLSGLDPKKLERFLSERKVRAVVIGPGTMENPLTVKSLGVLCDFSKAGFVVLDAAALHGIVPLLRKSKKSFAEGRVILTPHPGEWRLLSNGNEEKRWPAPLDADGVLAVEHECADLGIYVLYKHSTPILCGSAPFRIGEGTEARALVFNEGSNAMGRAGTGDVLAGCIAAHGAIGCDAAMATMRALAVVSSATQLAANLVGRHAVLPSDIISMLGKVDTSS